MKNTIYETILYLFIYVLPLLHDSYSRMSL